MYCSILILYLYFYSCIQNDLKMYFIFLLYSIFRLFYVFSQLSFSYPHFHSFSNCLTIIYFFTFIILHMFDVSFVSMRILFVRSFVNFSNSFFVRCSLLLLMIYPYICRLFPVLNRLYKYRREQEKEAKLGENLALNGKPRQHHPCCPRFKLVSWMFVFWTRFLEIISWPFFSSGRGWGKVCWNKGLAGWQTSLMTGPVGQVTGANSITDSSVDRCGLKIIYTWKIYEWCRFENCNDFLVIYFLYKIAYKIKM